MNGAAMARGASAGDVAAGAPARTAPATKRARIWWLVHQWAGLKFSLLLSFGRHAPFYQLFYALPYASTIRNPGKFLAPLGMAQTTRSSSGLPVGSRAVTVTVPANPYGAARDSARRFATHFTAGRISSAP